MGPRYGLNLWLNPPHPEMARLESTIALVNLTQFRILMIGTGSPPTGPLPREPTPKGVLNRPG